MENHDVEMVSDPLLLGHFRIDQTWQVEAWPQICLRGYQVRWFVLWQPGSCWCWFFQPEVYMKLKEMVDLVSRTPCYLVAILLTCAMMPTNSWGLPALLLT